MTIQELEIRISKKEEEIAKREKNLAKYVVSEEYTRICDRFFETDDRTELNQYRKDHNLMFQPEYYSKRYELEDAKKTLEKYRKALETAKDKQNTLSEMPEAIINFKNSLIERWDAYDEWKRNSIKEDYRRYIDGANSREEYLANRREMREKWGAGYYDFMYLTSEQIHKANVQAAETIVLNLIERTIEIAGKITDCRGLVLDRDNQGCAIINGLIIGEKGKAKVESIGAGGYNIQRYHIRVLVKEVK